MSGHEKHYIPHDDLLALIAAIESLELAIDALEVSTRTLAATIPLPKSEDWDSDTGTNTNTDQLITLRETPLDADIDTYLRRLVVLIENASNDPIITRYSNIILLVGTEDGNTIFEEPLLDSSHPISYTGTKYTLARTYTINESRIPAGDDYIVSAYWNNINTGTQVLVFSMFTT